ncbi:tetratricopeptide repeat protein [Longimicrobium sp.]|uniref:tetratricopeptide repeat protein n=1 Tax=Longimicrobium sp. TaxID=2029185 RepID=UPI003B3BE3CC
MEPVTTLAVAGIGWIASATMGGIAEGVADRTFVATVRRIQDRLPSLARRPEGDDLARGVRQAQLHALKRLTEEYRAQLPLARLGGGADPFSGRVLEFCRSAAALPLLPPSVTSEALLALAPASADLEGLAAGAASMEDAVLSELVAALDGISVPDAFVDHLRNGGRGTPRFMELFGICFAEQVKKDAAFREVLHTGLLLQNAANLGALGDWLAQVEARFGGTLARLESGMVDLAAQHQAGTDAILRAIAAEKGVPAAALRSILEKLGESGVQDSEILTRLSTKADEYRALREQLSRLAKSTPNASVALSEGNQLLNTGDLDGARRLFADARAALRATREQHARDEAALLAAEAGVDRLQLRYRDAASRYEEAERLVESFDPDALFDYLCRRAIVLQQHGNEFGDTAALTESISLWRRAGQQRSRSESPLEWAMTQDRLGSALHVLGERVGGIVRLEESLTVLRAALEERTRERVPLQWAATQNNLGATLFTLGSHRADPRRLEEALAAFRAALEEHPRDCLPLDWAKTQSSVGTALLALGEREGDVARLGEAVGAFRAALEERPRAKVPLDWAATQTNLAFALWRLGVRESGSARLEEAVTIYRAVLEENTRKRVPLRWARTQYYLGNALVSLGVRENSTGRLEEARAAFLEALEEQTRERVPFDRIKTQDSLASVLLTLGTREGDTARLEEAVCAYYAALEERPPEFMPLGFPTKIDLANALRTLGERESGTARLEEAVAAYRAALEERFEEPVTPDWVTTHLNLGMALLMLGERENGIARLNESIDCLRAASKVLDADPTTFQVTLARAHLARAQLLLQLRTVVAYDSWCRPPEAMIRCVGLHLTPGPAASPAVPPAPA